MNEQIRSILAQETTKTNKIRQLFLLGVPRAEIARMVTNGNYGFVVNALRRAQTSARYSGRLAEVSDIWVSGGAVRISLTTDNRSFVSRLDIPIVKSGTESSTFPIGTGPYVVTENVLGQYCVIERNDNYWGTPGIAKTFRFKVIPDAETRYTALRAGEVQGLCDLGGDIPAVAGAGKIQYHHSCPFWGRSPASSTGMPASCSSAANTPWPGILRPVKLPS